jgi:hypothetical protein
MISVLFIFGIGFRKGSWGEVGDVAGAKTAVVVQGSAVGVETFGTASGGWLLLAEFAGSFSECLADG